MMPDYGLPAVLMPVRNGLKKGEFIMIDFKEYSRRRDIAQKRIKRLQQAGVTLEVEFPKVKEIRSSTDSSYAELMYNALTDFLSSDMSLDRRREKAREEAPPEVKRKRAKEREYRRKKIAKEYDSGRKSKTYQGYLKGLKKLGVDIPPAKLPYFFEYMDYRFAQGNTSKKYVFDIFVDDYQTMLKKGYSPSKIVEDFDLFLSNQMELEGRKKKMTGYSISAKKAISLWDKYVSR